MNYSLSPVVRVLLVINLVVFALQAILFDPQTGTDFITQFFGLRYFESDSFLPYQFVTYMFLHGDLMHIFSNMFGLFMFGPLLEGIIGSRKFFLLYMVAGIGAGILNMSVLFFEMKQLEKQSIEYISNPTPERYVSYLSKNYPKWHLSKQLTSSVEHLDAQPDQTTESVDYVKAIYHDNINGHNTVGASGAIFGLLVAFAMIYPNLEMFLLFFPFPIKAKYFVTIYILYEVYAGLGYAGASNIAHFAHLSGALIGFLMIRYWKIPRRY